VDKQADRQTGVKVDRHSIQLYAHHPFLFLKRQSMSLNFLFPVVMNNLNRSLATEFVGVCIRNV
jgi:hypothetical protein